MFEVFIAALIDLGERLRVETITGGAEDLDKLWAKRESIMTHAASTADKTSCLILDVGLPGMSGPELQQELMRRGKAIPIVFITAQGDASLHRRLVAAGAAACLSKPFSDVGLLGAVETAIGTR